MCCMLGLVLKGRNNLCNVVINMPGAIAGDICIKIEKPSGKLQPGVVLERKINTERPGPCSELTCSELTCGRM